jgi:hypothetical protein
LAALNVRGVDAGWAAPMMVIGDGVRGGEAAE